MKPGERPCPSWLVNADVLSRSASASPLSCRAMQEEPHPDEEVVDKPLHRRLLVIVPALVLLGLIVFGALTRVEPRTAAGGSAPEFELPLLDGSGTLSSEDLKGSPVVFNFFASWCFPCREEAPALQRLATEYADEGVRVVGVNVQGGLPPTLLDSEVGAREFVEEFGITYPVVADKDGSLAKDLMDFYGLPQTFFVDHEWLFAGSSAGEKVNERQGAVVLGAISEGELRRTIEALVADAQEA